MNIKTQKYMGALALLVVVASAASFSVASAQTAPAAPAAGAQGYRGGMMGMHKPGIMGTVTAISGDTITVTAKQFAMHQRGAAAGSTSSTATATRRTRR